MDSVRAEHLLLLILGLGLLYFFARTLYLLVSRDHWREQALRRPLSADANRLLEAYSKGVLDLTGKMLWSDDEKQHREHVPPTIRSYNEGVLFLLRACNESGTGKVAAIASATGRPPDHSPPGGSGVAAGKPSHLKLIAVDDGDAEEGA